MVLQAWLLLLFPLHFFFHFLYYTDVGSLLFVVASYLVSSPDCMPNTFFFFFPHRQVPQCFALVLQASLYTLDCLICAPFQNSSQLHLRS